MISWMRERLNKEEGFTLVELMVVVLIIAILIAIAIPTFLGARERAQDRAAQSNLRNALTAEKVFYVDEESYATEATDADGDLTADLTQIEPSLTFLGVAAFVPATALAGDVYVNVSDTVNVARPQIVCLSSLSASGTLFVEMDIASGASAGTYYGDDVAGAIPGCNADPDAVVAGGWDQTGF